MKESQLQWIYRISILIVSFLAIYLFLKLEPIWHPILQIAKIIIIPIIISSFITYLLHPVVEKLHYRGLPRSAAILLIYLFIFGGVGYALYQGIPVIISQLKDFADSLPAFINKYRAWLYEIEQSTSHLPPELHDRIDKSLASIEEGAGTLLTRVLTSFKTIINSVLLLAIIPVIVFYMLKDYDLIKKSIWYMTPRRLRKSGLLYLKDVDESLGNYIRGQLLVCLIIGVIASIGLWLAGMKYPLLLGIIIGTTNIIPYFGPLIGMIPGVIIAATISVKMVIIVVVLIFVLQFIEGNLLSPIIVGKSLHMHPIIIILVLLLGGEMGGVIGMIVAVPIAAILKVSIFHAKAHFTKH